METPLCGNLSHECLRDEPAPGGTLAPSELRSRTSVSLHHRSTPWPSRLHLLNRRRCRGVVPEDLSQDNLSTWVDTVQDVAAGMIVPQQGTDQIIFPQVVELLTLLESVSRVAFCRQCYLPGSACRCLESSSTASTASTTGPLWSDIADPTFGTNPAPAGRGAGLALGPYGSSATAGGSHLGSAFYGFPRAPWGTFCHSPTTPPCWEGFSFGKPTHGHPVWTDCTARSPETSSADLDATYHTEPPTGSAASASA